MVDENARFTGEDAAFLTEGELEKINLARPDITSVREFSTIHVSRAEVARALGKSIVEFNTIITARRRTERVIGPGYYVDERDDVEVLKGFKESLPQIITKPPLEQLEIYLKIMEKGEHDVFLGTKLKSDVLNAIKRISSGGTTNLIALRKLEKYFSKDIQPFFLFVDIIDKQGAETLEELGRMLDLHQEDIRLCEALKLTTESSGSYGLKLLIEARELCGADQELFYNTFIEYMKLGETGVSIHLIEEKKKKDAGKKNIFDLLNGGLARIREGIKPREDEGKDDRISPYTQLVISSEAYENNIEMFEVFLRLIVEGKKLYMIQALTEAKKAYKENMKRFGMFVSIVDDGKPQALEDLTEAYVIYGDDEEMFEAFFRVAKRQRRCKELIQAQRIYGDNKELFFAFAKVAEEAGNEACKGLVKVEDAYKDDPEAFQTFFEVALAGGNCSHLREAKEEYWDNPKIFRLFVRLAKERSKDPDALLEFLKAAESYPDDIEVLEDVFELTLAKGAKACDGFLEMEELYDDKKTITGYDQRKLKSVIRFLGKYDYDQDVCEEYMKCLLEEGEARAETYMENLHQKAKKLIGGNVEEVAALRLMVEYEYMVAYVFPQGNYSTYEKNLKCGDHSKDLAKYHYDHSGYAIELTGVKGYKIKEGVEENKDLLGSYQDRIKGISDFIQDFLKDEAGLRLAYGKKVRAAYAERNRDMTIFGSLGELDEKDQLLALVFVQAMRDKSSEDPTVADLVVLYKYVYEEDLQAYIQRTADEARGQRDETSQNYILWRELSTIYGENMRHVMQHYVLRGGEKAADLTDIFLAEMRQRGVEKNWKLTDKQRDNIELIILNSGIADDVKMNRLSVTLNKIYGANIDFKGNERNNFRQEISQKIQQWLAGREYTLVSFEGVLHPQLYQLRGKYLVGIDRALSRMINRDINRINEEISRYEPEFEVDEKEMELGGEKSKKITKKAKIHKIRGYYAKTPESANARMGAYLCNAGENMYKNPAYFEFIMQNEETGKCEGLTMHIDIKTKNGKRYLWFGPNPFESFLDKVSAEACYDYQYKKVIAFAEENGFDGVVVPPKDEEILGECTNRGGMFPDLIKKSRLRNADGTLKTVDFDGSHQLSDAYSYSSGALIWEKDRT